MAEHEHLETAVLLLIGGMSAAGAREVAVSKLGLTPTDAKALIAAAARKITLAARFNRDRELGRSISRLQDCYRKSMAIQDIKTCLAVQRELNRLMALTQPPRKVADANGAGEASAVRRLNLIESYLLPLKLTDDRYPVEEHARVATEQLRQIGALDLDGAGQRGERP